jgi:hypothetical protein
VTNYSGVRGSSTRQNILKRRQIVVPVWYGMVWYGTKSTRNLLADPIVTPVPHGSESESDKRACIQTCHQRKHPNHTHAGPGRPPLASPPVISTNRCRAAARKLSAPQLHGRRKNVREASEQGAIARARGKGWGTHIGRRRAGSQPRPGWRRAGMVGSL